ncbi:ABC transporter ATP-binding protein [Lacibacterium aquatile]|uniref:ABC transporter ATP-binding protein n=1 Tax=Lacibacterium aquatile TaxID=1168082 RepID=A0ABW5DJK1_9PROT
MSDAILQLDKVRRSYKTAEAPLEVLRGADLTLRPGEMVGLIAPSGAGKSTLLHIAGLLENPTEGKVLVGGQDCSRLDDGGRTAVRRTTIGFVYQFHQLLPEFSALENVILPQMIAGVSRSKAKVRATELLSAVGLGKRLDHRPAKLSGGEQQRVAIVRAIANQPKLLLADEPTGNLDPTTAEGVFKTLQDLVRNAGLAALIATHNLELAGRMDRVVTLKDGILVAA